MSLLREKITSSFTPLQKTILKGCAVIGAPCLIILGIDQFIVQPRQSLESAPVDAASIQVKVSPPKLDLKLDEQLRQTRAELDALRLERERQWQRRREQNESADRDDPR